MIRHGFLAAALIAGSLALGACGDGPSAPASADADGERRCVVLSLRLLAKKQAANVAPTSNKEYVADSGGALIEGADSYHCANSEQDGAVLTIIWRPQRAG